MTAVAAPLPAEVSAKSPSRALKDHVIQCAQCEAAVDAPAVSPECIHGLCADGLRLLDVAIAATRVAFS